MDALDTGGHGLVGNKDFAAELTTSPGVMIWHSFGDSGRPNLHLSFRILPESATRRSQMVTATEHSQRGALKW